MLPRAGPEIMLRPVHHGRLVRLEVDLSARGLYLDSDATHHEINMLVLGGIDELLEIRRVEPPIGIHDHDVLAASARKGRIERLLAAACRQVLDHHPDVTLHERVEHARARILRARIDSDQLDIAQRLILHTLHCATQGLLGIMDAKKDRHLRRCGREMLQLLPFRRWADQQLSDALMQVWCAYRHSPNHHFLWPKRGCRPTCTTRYGR